MNKRVYCFVLLLVTAGLAFADFKVVVDNKTDQAYRKIVLGLHAVGFNANYGRFELDDISPKSKTSYNIPTRILTVPLTGTDFPCGKGNCNLDVNVIAAPERGRVKNTQKESVLKHPTELMVGDLRGLQPPDMDVVLESDGVSISFCEQGSVMLDE